MRRLFLTTITLLMGISAWSQNTSLRAVCNMQIRHEVTAPSCLNGMDGKIVLKVSGAKRPFTVQWSDQGEGEVRTGIVGGPYVATVRDAEGCVKRYEVKVPEGNAIPGSLLVKQNKASGATHLNIMFADGSKPAAIRIKNVSQGVRSPWYEYKGEALKEALYVVEAYTQVGCSLVEKIDLRIN